MIKKLNRIIITGVLGVVSIVSVWYDNYLVSHICFLFMGMILGAVIMKRSKILEKWSRKKLEGTHV